MFVSLVILKSDFCLRIFITSFLIFSAWGPYTFSKQAKPSSMYKPTLSFSYVSPNMLRMYTPTRSQIFRPSKTTHSKVEIWITFSFNRYRCIIEWKKFARTFTSSLLIVPNELVWFFTFIKGPFEIKCIFTKKKIHF